MMTVREVKQKHGNTHTTTSSSIALSFIWIFLIILLQLKEISDTVHTQFHSMGFDLQHYITHIIQMVRMLRQLMVTSTSTWM